MKAKKGSIVTYSGRRVWPLEMTARDVFLADIIGALPHLCRYNGHVDGMESVAQHSVIMFDRARKLGAPKTTLLQILLHDAHEIYCGDMVAPLKHLPEFEFFRVIEDRCQDAVWKRYHLGPVDPLVHELDLAVREAEIRDLKSGKGKTVKWRDGGQFGKITPWSPKKARREFVKRLESIGITVRV